MTTQIQLVDRVRGCFVGTMLGEALGASAQAGHAGNLEALTNLTNHREGRSSVAWQRTAACARALQGDRLTFRSVFEQELNKEFKLSMNGWGKTTQGVLSGTGNGRLLFQLDSITQGDHDVALGASPIALAIHLERARTQCGQTGQPRYDVGSLEALAYQMAEYTHRNAEAKAAAWVAGGWVIEGERQPLEKAGTGASPLRKDLWSLLARAEQAQTGSTGLADTLRVLQEERVVSKAEILRDALKHSWPNSVHATIPHALGICLRHPHDLREGLFEAATHGQNPCATAALVGTFLGFRVGLSGIPPEWIQQYPASQEALDLADDFLKSFE